MSHLFEQSSNGKIDPIRPDYRAQRAQDRIARQRLRAIAEQQQEQRRQQPLDMTDVANQIQRLIDLATAQAAQQAAAGV